MLTNWLKSSRNFRARKVRRNGQTLHYGKNADVEWTNFFVDIKITFDSLRRVKFLMSSTICWKFVTYFLCCFFSHENSLEFPWQKHTIEKKLNELNTVPKFGNHPLHLRICNELWMAYSVIWHKREFLRNSRCEPVGIVYFVIAEVFFFRFV